MSGFEVDGFTQMTLLRRGGFASVYRGTEISSGEVFAFKVLDRVGEIEESRFRRERESYERLASHPNIVRVLGGGREPGGAPYLMMEYLPGGALDEIVASQGKLSAEDAAWVGDRMLAALDFAHKQGVLHRDVKPSNILLGLGTVKLGDFGVAKFQDATQTTVSAVASTLSFAAPEVLRGEAATASSDLYSLGATLHNIVTGRALAGSWQATLADAINHTHHEIDMSGVPERLVGVLHHLLNANSSFRPNSAAEARAELAPIVPLQPSETLLRHINATASPQMASPTSAGSVEDDYRTVISQRPRHDSPETVTIEKRGRPKILQIASAVILGLLAVAGAILLSRYLATEPTTTTTTGNVSAAGTASSPASTTAGTIPASSGTAGGSQGGGSGGDPGGGGGDPGGGNAGGGGDPSGGGNPPSADLVPKDVIGRAVTAAKAFLLSKNIASEVRTKVSSADKVGVVLEVIPAEGDPIPDNRTVTLIVGEGAAVSGDVILATDRVACTFSATPLASDSVAVFIPIVLQNPSSSDLGGLVTLGVTGDNNVAAAFAFPVNTTASVRITMEADRTRARFINITASPGVGVPDSDTTNNRVRIDFTLPKLVPPLPLTVTNARLDCTATIQ